MFIQVSQTVDTYLLASKLIIDWLNLLGIDSYRLKSEQTSVHEHPSVFLFATTPCLQFRRDVVCQKLLKSANVSRSHSKNKSGLVF